MQYVETSQLVEQYATIVIMVDCVRKVKLVVTSNTCTGVSSSYDYVSPEH